MIPSLRKPRFKVGERAVIVMGGHKGQVVTIREIRPGWPYPNYTTDHDSLGQFLLNERELGIHLEKTNAGASGSAKG